MTQEDKERKAFEEWAVTRGFELDRHNNNNWYHEVDTGHAWLGWQAAKADSSPKSQELPQGFIDDMPYPIEWIEQWCGGIDTLAEDENYNVTGTHLKQLLMSYRILWQAKADSSPTMTEEEAVEIAEGQIILNCYERIHDDGKTKSRGIQVLDFKTASKSIVKALAATGVKFRKEEI